MMHFKSTVRSLVVFNTATKAIVNTTRNCRINYVCKLFFSSIPTHARSTMPTLSPSKVKSGGVPAADSSVQRVADQLASVALQQPQLQTGKTDPTLQSARPKRRVASKVVSYTDAGASSQDSGVSSSSSGDSEGDASNSHSVTQSVGGGRQHSKSRPVYWTDEMDTRLTEGVAQHKAQSWARVAEFMGDGLSADQCQHRWNNYLKHRQKGLKSSNWQPDEVKCLLELVPQHLTQKGTNWTAIGEELGRVPMDCNDKYNSIQNRKMKQRHFTVEEDSLIRQRVEEWGDKGNGLWVVLEKEMGRPGVSIRARWLILHDTKATMWTDEMDARLTEGVTQHKADGWARVAKFMGDGLSAQQCSNRWNIYLKHRQKGLSSGNWQPNELDRLLELVSQYLIPSHRSTRLKVKPGAWEAIGEELGRIPQDCWSKYRSIQDSKMTEGHFTVEEDALIRQRVEEWGDKGNGLWVALENEMDRSAKNISHRWRLVLSKKQ